MKKLWKKRAVVAGVLLLVAAAVYLNWRYTDQVADSAKVLGESTLVSGEAQVNDTGPEAPSGETPAEDDYFATARLSRKQARDSAIGLLQEAEVDENADEETLNEASRTLQVLAAYTVAESQIESLVTAKGYRDCVAFMGAESISVVVSAPDGLDAADVARIKDIVITETNYTPDQIKIVEAN
jgi:stage III sporulation protein AH